MQKRALDILSSNLDRLLDDWLLSMSTVLPAETWAAIPVDELSDRARVLLRSVIEGLAAEMSSDFSLGGEIFAEAMKMGQRSKDRGYELHHLVQEFTTLRERLWELLRTNLRQSDAEFINTVARMNATIDQLLLWSSDAFHTAWVEELEQRAITDSLTGIFTHGYLSRRLDEEVERGHRYGHPVTLLMVDLDGLKIVNDRFGHLAGDAVLRQVASLLVATSRRVDVVARYGGDEFGVIMPQTSLAGGQSFAERTVRAMPSNIGVGEQGEVAVTVSVGLATYPADADTARGLIEVADRTMYRAKAMGGNTVCWSDGSSPAPPAAPRPAEDALTVQSPPRPGSSSTLHEVADRLERENREMDGLLAALRRRTEVGAGFEKSMQDTVASALKLVTDMRHAMDSALSMPGTAAEESRGDTPRTLDALARDTSPEVATATSRPRPAAGRSPGNVRPGPLAEAFQDLTARRAYLETHIERMLSELQAGLRDATPDPRGENRPEETT